MMGKLNATSILLRRGVFLFGIWLIININFVSWAQFVTFTDVSQFAGVAKPDSGTGHGVAFADFDGDGFLDIYLVNWWNQPNFLFINNGNGTFTDKADQYGVTVPKGADRGVCAADYDNDGDMDLYINAGGQNHLFRNDGDHFTDVTYHANVSDWGQGMNVCFGDYNCDGFLDLLIANQGTGWNELFYNNGNGTFSKVTDAAGLGENRHSNGAVFFDYDNDGYPDIFIARGTKDENFASLLYHNNGNGTFTEMADHAGLGAPGDALGVAVGDYNNDGYLDLYVTEENQPNRLYRNNGNGTFTDVAAQAGVADDGRNVGCTFGDFNNDGFLDIYETTYGGYSHLFRNNGDGTFSDVSSFAHVLHWGNGFGLTIGDYNRDGQVDIFMSNAGQRAVLFKNNGSNNHWLALKLIGEKSNRSAIGARIVAYAGGKRQIREIGAGSSYVSENSLEVYFGLGDASVVDSLLIKWPSGIIQKYYALSSDQYVNITEKEPPTEPKLAVNPKTLDMGYTRTEASFQIHNAGKGELHWQVSNNQNAPWIGYISPSSGSGDGTVTISVVRDSLNAGVFETTLHILSNGGEDSVHVIVKEINPQNFNLRVNAGGAQYVDKEGKLWYADQPYALGSWGYVGGTVYSVNDSVRNTSNSSLYQTERYGMEAYKFDVPNGRYAVVLHFAEIFWHEPGKRVFNVSVNDSLILTNYDIFAEVGADYATIHTCTTKVTDGLLTIGFASLIDNAKISAIEIVGLSSPDFPVEFASFSAYSFSPNHVTLKWTTQTETQNWGFVIERKNLQNNFERIGFVKGSGTTSQPSHYFFDDSVNRSGRYFYRLKQIDLNGKIHFSPVAQVDVKASENTLTLKNYPNPFNNSTVISFSIPAKCAGDNMQVTIYDIMGNVIRHFEEKNVQAGVHNIKWNGLNQKGQPVASDFFICRLKVGNLSLDSKMVMIK